jgi:hypothetical protein
MGHPSICVWIEERQDGRLGVFGLEKSNDNGNGSGKSNCPVSLETGQFGWLGLEVEFDGALEDSGSARPRDLAKGG